MKLLIMRFSPVISSLFGPKSSQHSEQTPSVDVPSLMSETKFHTHTEPQAKSVLYILMYMFLGSRQEDKRLDRMVASIT
jgi:hypothetical protein